MQQNQQPSFRNKAWEQLSKNSPWWQPQGFGQNNRTGSNSTRGSSHRGNGSYNNKRPYYDTREYYSNEFNYDTESFDVSFDDSNRVHGRQMTRPIQGGCHTDFSDSNWNNYNLDNCVRNENNQFDRSELGSIVQKKNNDGCPIISPLDKPEINQNTLNSRNNGIHLLLDPHLEKYHSDIPYEPRSSGLECIPDRTSKYSDKSSNKRKEAYSNIERVNFKKSKDGSVSSNNSHNEKKTCVGQVPKRGEVCPQKNPNFELCPKKTQNFSQVCLKETPNFRNETVRDVTDARGKVSRHIGTSANNVGTSKNKDREMKGKQNSSRGTEAAKLKKRKMVQEIKGSISKPPTPLGAVKTVALSCKTAPEIKVGSSKQMPTTTAKIASSKHASQKTVGTVAASTGTALVLSYTLQHPCLPDSSQSSSTSGSTTEHNLETKKTCSTSQTVPTAQMAPSSATTSTAVTTSVVPVLTSPRRPSSSTTLTTTGASNRSEHVKLCAAPRSRKERMQLDMLVRAHARSQLTRSRIITNAGHGDEPVETHEANRSDHDGLTSGDETGTGGTLGDVSSDDSLPVVIEPFVPATILQQDNEAEEQSVPDNIWLQDNDSEEPSVPATILLQENEREVIILILFFYI